MKLKEVRTIGEKRRGSRTKRAIIKSTRQASAAPLLGTAQFSSCCEQHSHQKQPEEERVCWAYTSPSQLIPDACQCRNLSHSRSRTCVTKLLTGLLLLACFFCFPLPLPGPEPLSPVWTGPFYINN